MDHIYVNFKWDNSSRVRSAFSPSFVDVRLLFEILVCQWYEPLIIKIHIYCTTSYNTNKMTVPNPQSDSSTEDKIIAQHLDELSLHLEQERVAAQIPAAGYRSRTSSQLSDGNGPPFPPLQVRLKQHMSVWCLISVGFHTNWMLAHLLLTQKIGFSKFETSRFSLPRQNSIALHGSKIISGWFYWFFGFVHGD